MTKNELIKENERLEQELLNARNSIEYWSNSYYSTLNQYEDLRMETSEDFVSVFLKDCSIIQKQQLENFINSL